MGKTKANNVEEKFEAEVNEDTADTNLTKGNTPKNLIEGGTQHNSLAKASDRKHADENENLKIETSDVKEII